MNDPTLIPTGFAARWQRTWRQTWVSLHVRTAWPEYLLSIGLLLGLMGLSRWIPSSDHLSVIVQAKSHPTTVPWRFLCITGSVGVITVPWLTGRFYSNAAQAITSPTPSLPWSWPWQAPALHGWYWTSGAVWIAGFLLYWLLWIAVLIAGAIGIGPWGAIGAGFLWAVSLPWLITWTGAIFVDHRQGRSLWKSSFTLKAWGFRWLIVWITMAVSVLVLGGLAWIMHPHTPLGLALTALAWLIIEYLLERFFNAWYLVTYWVCIREDPSGDASF